MAEYIEREAAIKYAEESYKMWCLTMSEAEGAREINKCYKMQELCKAMGETFKIVPSADVAPVVHGHWDDSYDGITPFCSVCGRTHHTIVRTPKYCPNCGAKMDEDVRE